MLHQNRLHYEHKRQHICGQLLRLLILTVPLDLTKYIVCWTKPSMLYVGPNQVCCMQEHDLPETARGIETSNMVPAPVQSAQQGTAGAQHGHNTNQGLGVSNAQQGSPRSASKRRADDSKGPCADCGTFGEPLQHSHQLCLLVA